jgi:hypothetical protein
MGRTSIADHFAQAVELDDAAGHGDAAVVEAQDQVLDIVR